MGGMHIATPIGLGQWLSLPALPSVPPRIRHSGVASPLRVGGAAAAARILEAGPSEEERFSWCRGGGDVA